MRNATIKFLGVFKSSEFNKAKENLAELNFPGCETWISKNMEMKVSMSSRDDVADRFFRTFEGNLKLLISPEFHWEPETCGFRIMGSVDYPQGLVAYQIYRDGEIRVDKCPFEVYEHKDKWIVDIHGLLQVYISYSKSLYETIEEVIPEIQKEVNKIDLKGIIEERNFFYNHKDKNLLKEGLWREYTGNFIF
jgi:hypothetical protein